MRIFVVGNINVGKSFVVSKLKDMFPNYPVISIDEYRIKYADGSVEKELKTRSIFANEIIQNTNAIIEFSGGSTITELFIKSIRKNSVVILEINESVSVCLNRIKEKDFLKIPYPKYTEKIEETIIRLDDEFKDNCIDKNFKNRYLKKYKLNSNCDLETLPLKQYELAIKVADALENKFKNLFTFGSLGSDKVGIYSDVDLFLQTEEKQENILLYLQDVFPEARTICQKNQIDIYTEDFLIEINLIKHLKEAQLFYKKSEIIDVSKTILLGEQKLYQDLKNLLDSYYENSNEVFNFTLGRFKYYVESLRRVANKNDRYKFYFHNNIVFHEYIRLTYFMNDKTAHNYLPKYALSFIPKSVYKKLIFSIDESMSEHIEVINELAEALIIKAEQYKKEMY